MTDRGDNDGGGGDQNESSGNPLLQRPAAHALRRRSPLLLMIAFISAGYAFWMRGVEFRLTKIKKRSGTVYKSRGRGGDRAAASSAADARDKKKKKFFAIHIGPSKTGTTTIQMESGRNPHFLEALRKDGVAYVGKFCRPADKGEDESYLEALNCTTNFINNMHDSNNGGGWESARRRRDAIKKECWEGDEKQRRFIESSLITSGEHHSYHPSQLLSKTIPELRAIFLEYLDYDEFIVIGAYRRYGEWMTSAYKEEAKQICVAKRVKPCKNVWKFAMKNAGKAIGFRARQYHNLDETMLPVMANAKQEAASASASATVSVVDESDRRRRLVKRKKPFIITPWASASADSFFSTATSLETAITTNTTTSLLGSAGDDGSSPSAKKIIKFDVLNYFQLPNDGHYNSITTELYCKSLGMDRTPNTCRYSRDGRSQEESNAVFHKGSSDMVTYHNIFAEAVGRGWIQNITWVNVQHPDRIEKSDRLIAQVMELADHHAKTLGMSATRNLPLLCPPRLQLKALLRKSMRLEQLIAPGFFATDLGKQEHNRAFWRMVDEKKSFCWVDMERLFQNATSWDDLLSNRLTIEEW